MRGQYAPYGGNVVGLEMAAWRYFWFVTKQLSWAGIGHLSCFANAASLIYSRKNSNSTFRKKKSPIKKQVLRIIA